MIVLRRAICRLVIEAIITRYVAVAIGPQKSDEVDAANDFAVFARPMAADEFNLFGIGLIKGRIVQHQYAACELNLMTRFLPEVFAARFQCAASKRLMASWAGASVLVWLHPGCFCAAINFRGSNQKINIIVLIALWGVHSEFLHYHASTA